MKVSIIHKSQVWTQFNREYAYTYIRDPSPFKLTANMYYSLTNVLTWHKFKLTLISANWPKGIFASFPIYLLTYIL